MLIWQHVDQHVGPANLCRWGYSPLGIGDSEGLFMRKSLETSVLLLLISTIHMR